MKNRERVDRNVKKDCVNNTVHQRAIKNPEAQIILSTLETKWKKLAPQQRTEVLEKLRSFGCSIRGIAKETGISASSLRRYKSSAKSADSESGWIKMMKGTLAKKPDDEPEMSRLEASRQARSMISAAKKGGPATKPAPSAPIAAHPSTAQQRAKTITTPRSALVKVPPDVDCRDSALGENEKQAAEGKPNVNLVDSYFQYKVQIPQERIRRLAEISESMERRRSYPDARSMEPQGKPRPPKD